MSVDEGKRGAISNNDPADRAAAVTLSDTDTFPPCRGLYVGVGGDVKVQTVGGDSVSFPNVPTASVLPVRVIQVFATGTTASSILRLW